VRAPEIRQSIRDRLHAMEEEHPVREPDYLQGLNEAVSKGVEYGLEVIAVGGERAPSIPLPLLAQARLAARHRIPHELVTRRYMAAKLVLTRFVLEEGAAIPGFERATLEKALAAQAFAFEQLVAAASDEYQRETATLSISREGRLAQRVRRLLSGESVDPAPLEYDLSGHHLGFVARSPEARPLLGELSAERDGRLLAVTPTEGETWAWIGARRPLEINRVLEWANRAWPDSIPLGIGEPAEGLSGWRRSHEQARAAAGIVRPGSGGAVRYRDAAMLTAIVRDPLLLASLPEMYLAPLDEKNGRGRELRQTLRAYFETNANAASAASALGVSRQTVANRLRAVEECLGLPVSQCADTLSAALTLEELGHFPDPPDSRS
jgi:PucR C-terminal helix-turn-helix domain/GGDEF-like domain